MLKGELPIQNAGVHSVVACNNAADNRDSDFEQACCCLDASRHPRGEELHRWVAFARPRPSDALGVFVAQKRRELFVNILFRRFTRVGIVLGRFPAADLSHDTQTNERRDQNEAPFERANNPRLEVTASSRKNQTI